MLTAPVQMTPWSLPEGDPLVRRATDLDLLELAALKRRVERRCYAHLGTPEALSVRLHRRCTASYLSRRLSAGDLMLVAELEGSLVGLGAARVDRLAGLPQLHLHSTYVEAPGRGLGAALTRARLTAADRLGLRVVTADCLVGADLAEQRLRRMGMVEVGARTASPTFPGVRLSHWIGSLHTALESVSPGALAL